MMPLAIARHSRDFDGNTVRLHGNFFPPAHNLHCDPMSAVRAFDWGHELPGLPGARVALRAIRAADVPDLFTVFSDAEVMRYWDGVPMTAIDEADAYRAEIDESFRGRTLFQWAIAEPAADRLIGTCTLLHLNAPHRRAEIGFALGRPHWGQGLASDAVTTLVRFAFGDLNLHRLEADVDPRNARSLRLLEKLGFRREGYLRERYHVAGDLQDAVLLGLLRSEWRGVT
jgi:[ribosomal protein S5]-alanine N-acetyltransferase